MADIKSEMRIRENMCSLKGINNHPLIFAIGTWAALAEFSNFYVVLLDLEFHFKSLLDAIDVAFKLFAMLSLQYPPESSNVWGFLNEAFYNIETQRPPSSTVQSIVSSFKKVDKWSND